MCTFFFTQLKGEKKYLFKIIPGIFEKSIFSKKKVSIKAQILLIIN